MSEWAARVGALSYAASLVSLAFLAGAQLLRPPLLELGAFGLCALGIIPLLRASPALGLPLSLFLGASAALVYAARAAARAWLPSPRQRVFLAACLLIGVVGAALWVWAAARVAQAAAALLR